MPTFQRHNRFGQCVGMRSLGLVTGLGIALGGAFVAPAAATGGLSIGGYGDAYEAFNDWSGEQAIKFDSEPKAGSAFVGDWDGDGRDTLAIRNGALITIYNDLSGADPAQEFLFWRPTDTIISGDWDGDGKDSFGIVSGNHFYLRNELGNGEPDYSFDFGTEGDLYLVGDWDGDGTDTLAAHQGSSYQFINQLADGAPVTNRVFGTEADLVVRVGDWDGDGTDTPLLRDENTLSGANTYRAFNSWEQSSYNSPPAEEFHAANVNDAVMVGDWDGDGRDTPGLRKFSYKAPGGDRAQVGQDSTSAIPDISKFRLRADAGAAWQQVIDLWGRQPSLNAAWRSFGIQRDLFVGRYSPAASGGGEFCDVRKWQGERYVRISNAGPAAVPGTSNHGAGLAVDVGGWTGFDDPQRLRFLALARDFGWADDEGCKVAEPWHLTYYPERDKGWSSWSPDDPVDRSASHCPNKEKLPTVPAGECKYN